MRVPEPEVSRGVSTRVPALLGLLGSELALDRRAAALALGKIGSAAAHALRVALGDRDAVVRRFASEALEVGRKAA